MDKIYLTVEIPIEIEIIGVHKEERPTRNYPGPTGASLNKIFSIN